MPERSPVNSRSVASPPTRSRPVIAVVLLLVFMTAAAFAWQVLPQPQTRWAPWLPIVAALIAARFSRSVNVLCVRNIAFAGSAFLLCQLAIQLLVLTGVRPL